MRPKRDGLPEWTFDTNIARAETIPSWLYTDAAVLPVEMERIFARTWQAVAHSGQLAAHGAFVATTIGDEPIVVVRDGDALRAFHNVCLHRAGPVAEGCGNRQTLQCRYHGWTYTLRGELKRAPEMEGVENFHADAMQLRPVRVEQWGPLVFATVDPDTPPLAHFLEDIPQHVARFRTSEMRWVMRKDWVVQCNWKVYLDNYLEGYHVPVVHPGLHKEIDYDEYKVETHRYYSRQYAPLRKAHHAGAERRYVPTETGDDAQYYWVFPNTMLNFYPGQLQTNVVLPEAQDRTRVIFEWFAADPPADPATDATWSSAIAFADEVQTEDVEICELVQRNLRSRVYDRGRYSVKRENGVHHFHALLHQYLNSG